MANQDVKIAVARQLEARGDQSVFAYKFKAHVAGQQASEQLVTNPDLQRHKEAVDAQATEARKGRL
eukprot:11167005-Lingulodinium_polyedra.AAC.1